MFNRRLTFFVLFFLVFGFFNVFAAEYSDGRIKVVINEKTGRFSLFYMTDLHNEKYEPLFNHGNLGATFFSVNINGKVLQLDNPFRFKISVEKDVMEPTVVYDSPSLQINQTFSFLRTVRAPASNGVEITFNLINKSDKQITAGLRMLLDTHLGEGRKLIPFVIDNKDIFKETVIKDATGIPFWVSHGKDISLMGSVELPDASMGKNPDLLHFANWKKLNNASWKAPFNKRKGFNNFPYSIGDSAVSYYFDGDVLESGESVIYTILLASQDEMGFRNQSASSLSQSEKQASQFQQEGQGESDAASSAQGPGENIPISGTEIKGNSEFDQKKADDMLTLKQMLEKLDQFINGEISLNEEDLANIEQSIASHKAQYGL